MIKKLIGAISDEIIQTLYGVMIKMYRHHFGDRADCRPGTAAYGYRLALVDIARAVFTPIGNDFEALVDRDIKGY